MNEGLGVDAQQVGIDLTAGKHDRIVVIGRHLGEIAVDLDRVTPIF
jgi:hypothetical protein